MRLKWPFVIALGFVIAAAPASVRPLDADSGPIQSEIRHPQSALAGRVSSVEEGPMEGVLVSARKAGSTITTKVVSDRQGEYRFPRARLEPGRYALRIRAVGFDLESDANVDIAAHQTTTADLKLR